MTPAELVVLVPALRRPGNVGPLVDSIRVSTSAPYRICLICDTSDLEEQRAGHAAGIDVLLHDGGYPSKINYGVRATTEPLIFLGADDLRFQTGWLDACRSHLDIGAQVIGVNDAIPRRVERVGHATHFLLTREYAQRPTIDETPGPLFEGYDHSFVDDELIATASHRGVYAYAQDAHVTHLHPMAGTAADDDTYLRGRRHFRHDRRRFFARRRLWET